MKTFLPMILFLVSIAGCKDQGKAVWGNSEISGEIGGVKYRAQYMVVGYNFEGESHWEKALVIVRKWYGQDRIQKCTFGEDFIEIEGRKIPFEDLPGKRIFYNDSAGEIKEYKVAEESKTFNCLTEQGATFEDIKILHDFLWKKQEADIGN